VFELIKTEPKEKANYMDIYYRLFCATVVKYYEDVENRDRLKQSVYYGVKFINLNSKQKDEIEYEKMIQLFDFTLLVEKLMSLLTPREFVTIFPIEKTYDGNKYECKDYFYVIKKLNDYGMDKILQDNITEMLWEYWNLDINFFVVNMFSVASNIKKIKTGKGFMEEWAEKNGITTYKLCKDPVTKKEYMYNPKTGKSSSIKRPTPRYLKVVKGGRYETRRI